MAGFDESGFHRLRPVAPEVWEYQFPVAIGLVPFTGRMTVVRLAGGGLWIHSPGPVSEAAVASIAELGEIAAIVAPNQFHHLFVGDFVEVAGTIAPVFAAPGLANKRPDLKIAATLSEVPPTLWSEDLAQLHLGGMPKFEEVVFLHHASRTLIVTDLVFNLGRDMPLRTQAATRCFGTYDRFAASRLFRSFIKDKRAFRRSFERLADWQYDRCVMAHGAVLEKDAPVRLEAAWQA